MTSKRPPVSTRLSSINRVCGSRPADIISHVATSRSLCTAHVQTETTGIHVQTSITWYFAVDDLEDVYRRAERLGGLSPAIGDGRLPMGQIAVRPWGERSFYLHDPFGNPLCFVDSRSLFTGVSA